MDRQIVGYYEYFEICQKILVRILIIFFFDRIKFDKNLQKCIKKKKRNNKIKNNMHIQVILKFYNNIQNFKIY